MKARLIFKTRNNEILTTDIDIEMENTDGFYSPDTDVLQLEFVGMQRLPDETMSTPIDCDPLGRETIDSVAKANAVVSRHLKEGFCL